MSRRMALALIKSFGRALNSESSILSTILPNKLHSVIAGLTFWVQIQ